MDDPNQKPTPVTPFGTPLPTNNPPQSKGSVDLRFAPSSAPAPKIEPAQAPTPSPVQPQQPASYKTSIRTMSDDIANLKTGQKPAGSEIEKTINTTPAPVVTPRQFIQESAPKPVTPPALRPASIAPTPPSTPPTQKPAPPPVPRITIPPIKASEAPRPQAPSITAQPLVPPLKRSETIESAPFISVPDGSSRPSKGRLYLLLGIGLILIVAIAWLLVRSGTEVATTTPTPNTTQTPTPTPVITLQSMFGGLSSASINLSATTNLAGEFKNQVNQISIFPGELKRLTITSVSKGGGELNLVDLMDRLQISYPVDLKENLGSEYIVLAYGQKEVFSPSGSVSQATISQPRLIFITRTTDTAKVTEILRLWESSMTEQLESLFGYLKSKAGSQTFLDNTYAGSSIRYKNYSFPDRTTDYSVVSANNNRVYLVLANSREGIYKVLDILR